MRARTIFIVSLVLILVFALWPAALGLGAEWLGHLYGCEVDFNRAIPCTINGQDWGQSIYEAQQWSYLLLFTIPVGYGLLAVWGGALLIYLIVRLVRRAPKSPSA
jgi:hypothetical protein